MSKILVLYIATGDYKQLFAAFYRSAGKHLFTGDEVSYLVFTDTPAFFTGNPEAGKAEGQKFENVTAVQIRHEPWPYVTLNRFHYFLTRRERISAYDYAVFVNADVLVSDTVLSKDVFAEGLVTATRHPGYFDKKRADFAYETNPASTAAIAADQGAVYVAGGLVGGAVAPFLDMCEQLAGNIDRDKANGVLAVWHDESHLNHFVSRNRVHLIPPAYLWPEDWDPKRLGEGASPKILLRNKKRALPGSRALRKYSRLQKLRNSLNKLPGKIRSCFSGGH